MPLAPALPGTFDDDVARLETGIDVAALEREMMRHIAFGIVVHEWCAGFERGGGQYCIVDFDQVDCGTRGRRVARRHGCDFIADVTHFVDRQRIEVGPKTTPFPARGIGAGDDRFYTGQRSGGGGVDVENSRVRMRAAQHRRMQHAGQMQVCHVLRGAGDLGNRIRARHILADDQQARGRTQIGVALIHKRAFCASATASR